MTGPGIERRAPQPLVSALNIYNWAIRLMTRVIINGPGDRSSILGPVIPKTQKMLYTQQYKVRIKGKVEQSRE